jgi:hypothetical protein
MGLVALVQPERVVRYFGTNELTVDGRNEVRAVYGGFGVAMGLLLLVSTSVDPIRPGVLLCLAVALLGMAAGRGISRAVDGRAGFYPWFYLGVEVLLSVALLAALFLSL